MYLRIPYCTCTKPRILDQYTRWLNMQLFPMQIYFTITHYVVQPNQCIRDYKTSGPWFNIKIPSYQYRRSHCGDKTILRPSYLHNGISYTGKMTSLYWISVQVVNSSKDVIRLHLPVSLFIVFSSFPKTFYGSDNFTWNCTIWYRQWLQGFFLTNTYVFMSVHILWTFYISVVQSRILGPDSI